MKLAPKPVRHRKSAPSPGAWSVVQINGEPIRRKARRDFEKVLCELDDAKAEAERFESEDRPKFDRWLSANFGALLTEMRELQEKLFNAQQLVNEVQQEFFYGNYRSIISAYRKVIKRRSNQEEPEFSREEAEDEEAEFRKEFEEVFGAAEEEFWEKLGGAARERANSRISKTQAQSASRLKDLYRILVRKLHPDKAARRTAKQVEWWHQTQAAYQSGNVEQLELILTLIEVEEKGTSETSVSVLAQLTAEFKRSLRALKRKISAFRKDTAWNFSRLTDFGGLFERTRQKLHADREEILWMLEKYERQIKTWERSLVGSGKRVSSGRGACRDEEWF